MTKIRAVICDVYRTILDVLPAPADAEQRWAGLAKRSLGEMPCSLERLSARCRECVAEDHAAAKAQGILFPEVVWPNVMTRALPQLAVLDEEMREDFLFEHMQLLRGLRLMPGAGDFLRLCSQKGLLLGIASNAQRYTLRELGAGLAEAGLTGRIFDPELSLWSWQLGFSKPNPHVFRILTARLSHRGIAPDEVLMVGDRFDNDMEPAHAAGMQTWWFGEEGGWKELAESLATRLQ